MKIGWAGHDALTKEAWRGRVHQGATLFAIEIPFDGVYPERSRRAHGKLRVEDFRAITPAAAVLRLLLAGRQSSFDIDLAALAQIL